MNTFVSGESDAKGLSVILPYIAVGPAAVAIRRPELWNAWNLAGQGWGAWQGWSKAGNLARRGAAGPGRARRGEAVLGTAWHDHGKEHGRAHPQEQQTNTT